MKAIICAIAVLVLQDLYALNSPPVLSISIPKCGTHLMGKLLGKMGYTWMGVRSESVLTTSYEQLKLLRPGTFFSPHLAASQQNIGAVSRCGFKVIFIYRDPRDQLVSLAHFVKNNGDVWTCNRLSISELITKFIENFSCLYYTTRPSSPWNDVILRDVGSVKAFYDLYLGWISYPNCFVTTFEKLIGTQGGGSDEVQHQEICNLARYLGRPLDKLTVNNIQRDLFGGTATFRTGQIGEWRSTFSPEQKELFKFVAGQLLIDLGYEQDFAW